MSLMCNCSTDDFDYPDFYTHKTVKARKPHKCCECQDEINPGEKYELVKGKWCGRIDSFKTCLPCVHIRSDYCPDGFLHGGLWEALHECLGIDYTHADSDDDDDEEDT
jgi:hypothetical protein